MILFGKILICVVIGIVIIDAVVRLTTRKRTMNNQRVPDVFDPDYKRRVDDNLRCLFLGEKPVVKTDVPPVAASEDVVVSWFEPFLKWMQKSQPHMHMRDFYDISNKAFNLDVPIVGISTPKVKVKFYLLECCIRQFTTRISGPFSTSWRDIPFHETSTVEYMIRVLNQTVSSWEKELRLAHAKSA